MKSEAVTNNETVFADGDCQEQTKSEVYRLVCSIFPSLAKDDLTLEERMLELASEAWRRCCGVFGWTGMPAAFQVVTRAIQYELDKKLKGLSCVYVDNVAGVTTRDSWLESDMRTATEICESLLGSGSVESTNKSLSGRLIDFLGYAIDVDQRLVGVEKKNVLKALHAYFQAGIDGSLKVTDEFQALASYAVRYWTICGLLMTPFVCALYVNIRGMNQYAVVRVSPASARTIILMRALLIFVSVLKGVRAIVIWIRCDTDNVPDLVRCIFSWTYSSSSLPRAKSRFGAVVAELSPLQFGSEAKYQNTAEEEFLCVVMAFRVMARRGITPGRTKRGLPISFKLAGISKLQVLAYLQCVGVHGVGRAEVQIPGR